ncbi:hypothetical protein LCGC14_2104950 [marine sediment metagenome]|uniref:Phosphoribosyltransferase domain-containing protein n=1 Tax=marine sediment metagenome TaxID=412755 RepID=A0A0F9EW24_9ZZZZ
MIEFTPENIFLNGKQIKKIVEDLSKKIERFYEEKSDVLLVAILDGAKTFSDNLLKHLSRKFFIRYIKAKSYEGTITTKDVDIDSSDLGMIQGRNILIVNDIYDKGYTLSSVLDLLFTMKPSTLYSCVLLEREDNHDMDVNVDFVGYKFKDDSFLVGYGLDYNGEYREVPFIFKVKK